MTSPHRSCSFALPLFLACLLLAASALAQPGPVTAEAAFADAYALFDARLFGEAERAFADFRSAYPTDTRTSEALYYGGEAALAAGNDEEAGRLLMAFRTRYPAHPLAPRARLALGEYYFATERYDEARRALGEAAEEDAAPEDAARALLLMGQTSLRQDRPGAAVATLRRVADTYPRAAAAPLALYTAGFAEVERGNYAAAADAFGRLARDYARSPEDRRVGLALAEAYLRTGQYDRVLVEGERRLPDLGGTARDRALFLLGDAALRLGRMDEADRYFAEITEDGPYSRRARFGQARIAWEREAWAAAADSYAAVRTASGEAFDDLAAEATYYEGIALKRTGQIDEAARRLAAVELRRPESPFADAALFERGFLLYGVRRWDEAAESFERLLDRYPTSAFAGEAARMLGETYAALGDFRRAERANERAEARGTASAEVQGEVAFQQGYGLYQSGDYAEAARQLQGLYRREPRGPRAGEALFWAAESSFQEGQRGNAAALDRAETLFTEFLSQFPDHRQQDAARYALAWAVFKRGDYARAAAAFERFLASYRPGTEIVPYTTDARLRLADAYFALKRFDEAVAVYRQVEGAGVGGADYALFQVGQAHANAGRRAEAQAAYDRLLTGYPDSALRAQTHYAKGALAFQAEDYPAAVASYQRVLGDHPGSPVAPKAQYGIGDARYNQGRLREATAAYRAVLERYPDSPFVVDALSGVQFALTAQGEEHRLDEVVRQYADRNPNAGVLDELRFRQAEGAFQSGNLRVAVEAFEDFLRTARDRELQAAAYLYLGRAHADLGEPDRAEPNFRRVVERFPRADVQPDAAARLGALYLSAERWDEALALYRSLSAGAATVEAGVEARLGEAEALLGLGRAADAEALFDAVAASVSGVLGDRAWFGLAQAAEAQGRRDEAVGGYERLATERDDELGADALVRLAEALLPGDPQGVLTAVERLDMDNRFAGYPDQVAETLVALARAFRALDEPGRAEETYQLVLDAYADTPAAVTAERER
ncbi:MAG: tetratricopeptide repeat protein [Bacteroidota bacterium]